jgi:hypothetical protein
MGPGSARFALGRDDNERFTSQSRRHRRAFSIAAYFRDASIIFQPFPEGSRKPASTVP